MLYWGSRLDHIYKIYNEEVQPWNEVFDERFIKILNESINRDIKDTEGYRIVQVFILGSKHISPEPKKVPNQYNIIMLTYKCFLENKI